MPETFILDVERIQPSQLFIDSSTLTKMMRLFATGGQEKLPPISIKELDGEYVATDGHTRLLAFFLNGYREVECEWENIEFDWDEYRVYVKWCKGAGITSIAGLQSRIIGPVQYEELWLKRCAALQKERGNL